MYKNLIILILGMLIIAGCNSSNLRQQNITILVDKEIQRDKNVGAAWLGYGLALANWCRENKSKEDTFEREVYARTKLARIWTELLESGAAKPDAALDDLKEVEDAGFMKEYVWYYLKKPTWTEPDSLRMERFFEWRDENIPKHKPVIYTGLKIE